MTYESCGAENVVEVGGDANSGGHPSATLRAGSGLMIDHISACIGWARSQWLPRITFCSPIRRFPRPTFRRKGCTTDLRVAGEFDCRSLKETCTGKHGENGVTEPTEMSNCLVQYPVLPVSVFSVSPFSPCYPNSLTWQALRLRSHNHMNIRST